MRLLELFSVTSRTGQMPSVPLWYLGGSYNDYIGYETESLMLYEANINRFLPMIDVFRKIDEFGMAAGIGNNWYNRTKKRLNWVLDNLRREDRIVWYMRIFKAVIMVEILNEMQTSGVRPTDEQRVYVQKVANASINKLKSIYGSNTQRIMDSMTTNTMTANRINETLAHMMGMRIPKIEQTVWDKQTPDELIQHFTALEDAWISKQSKVIDTSLDTDAPEVETVVEFPDGSAWFNLNREFCSLEARAMGHCGNDQPYNEGDRVLSYRVPVDEDGNYRDPKKVTGTHWRPSLTFILDRNGNLGEMKGRANDKPSKKYHPQIIALLLNPIVKGIVGGGHQPEKNFSLEDLEDSVAAEVLRKKPELGNPEQVFKILGYSRETMQSIDRWAEHEGLYYIRDISKLGLGGYRYVGAQVWANVKELIEDRAGPHADTLLAYAEGNFPDDELGAPSSYVVELLDSYFQENADDLVKLQEYVKSIDVDSWFGGGDEADYDINSVHDLVEFLEYIDSDIVDTAANAIDAGAKNGIAIAATAYIQGWLENPFGNPDIKGRFQQKPEDNTGDGLTWDQPVWLLLDVETVTSELIAGNDSDLYYGEENLVDFIEFKSIELPEDDSYNYSEGGALSYLEDNLVIPDVEKRGSQ